MNNNPLVSILVVTYNSADYILETLESVRKQTYDNLELIISDDCSSDSTVDIASKWIESNKERFARTEIITVEKNTGVSANYNRGIKACHGEWLKNIDGDDLITPQCVEANIRHISENPEIEVLFSDMIVFRDSEDNILYKYSDSDFNGFFDLPSDEQYKRLIQKNCLPSTPLFIKTRLLQEYGYDERYIGMEDYPMWVKLTQKGHKVYYFNEITAKYRKGESVTTSRQRLYSPVYMDSLEMFYWGKLYKPLKDYGFVEAKRYYEKYFFLYHLAILVFRNKGNFVYRAVFSILRRWMER